MRPCQLFVAGIVLALYSRVAGADWLESRVEIEALADAGELEAAVALEEEFMRLVEEEFGVPSLELADAYLLMGTVYSAGGRYIEAEDRILAALDTVERIEGPLSTRLVDGFVALGDNYDALGEHELAIGAYSEARALGRRSFGLFHAGQIPILERMSDATLSLDRFEEASRLQQEALALYVREHGPDSLGSLERHYDYAEWLDRHGDVRSANAQYSSMARMIRSGFDNDPRLMLRLLRTDADTARRYLYAPGNEALGIEPGEPAELNEALAVLDRLPEPRPLLRAELLLELADWNTAFDRTWDISESYRAVWNALADVENGDSLRREWFAETAYAYAAPLDSRHLSDEEDAPVGQATAVFTVNIRGLAEDVEIVESEPPGMIDRAARRAIRDSRFRPRMVDGELVESTASVSWNFRYRD